MHARFALAMMFTVACTSGSASTGIEPMSCPPESTLTYENFGKDMISSNCLSCHDTKSPRLTTQAQIKAVADAILDTAVYTDAMPKSNGMPLQQRELLGEWLACGAP